MSSRKAPYARNHVGQSEALSQLAHVSQNGGQAACMRRGGEDVNCRWIPQVGLQGQRHPQALVRRLKLAEIESMNFPGSFRPSPAYDGVLQRSNDVFESCLCPFDKWAWWKNKNDVICERFGRSV